MQSNVMLLSLGAVYEAQGQCQNALNTYEIVLEALRLMSEKTDDYLIRC
jgi:hypothetical protein